MNQKVIEAIAPRLTQMMIKKIETLTTGWHKPWIADMTHGLPRNLRGTPYRAGNVLMLLFFAEEAAFRAPVFLTFKQAKEEGLMILKGAASFPVYFWRMFIRHKDTKRKIDQDEYYRLPKQKRKQYDAIPVMRYYSVFNIDQTDMREQQPERYAALTATTERKNYSDGINCKELDELLSGQRWLCPIDMRYSDTAAYTPSVDRIVCPLKGQFPEGAAFYSTLLHEMAHSTGTGERLNRGVGTMSRLDEYAREELVAELTAALCGAMLGFAATPRDENAAYLKGWLDNLHRKPDYLFDILSDVNKAARMISGRLEPEALSEAA